MKNSFLSLILITLGLVFLNFKKDNFVPDKDTAIKIAEAIWLPIYGKSIYDNLPFEAHLIGDTVWSVVGTLPQSFIEINNKGDSIIHITQGGVPRILIKKDNCEILEVSHSK